MVVNELKKIYPHLKIALEQPISRGLLLKRRVKKVGLFAVFGQLLFMVFLIILRKLHRKRLGTQIVSLGLDVRQPPNILPIHFESVNSGACIAWLKEESPDVVVLNGTRIVSENVLNSVDAIFLNLHCGITPAYRGVHGAYWALYHNDSDNAGVTIHVVDKGIDTGDVIYQEVIQVNTEDNFLTYPLKQYQVGIPLMQKAIYDVSKQGLVTTRRTDLPTAVWQHPTLWQYCLGRWFRGVK